MADYKRAMGNLTGTEASAKEADKTLAQSNARYDAEIKRLESAKVIIIEFRQKLVALQDREDGVNYTELASQVRSYLAGVKDQLSGLVEKSKQISAAGA